jgi:hypothetical protein
VPGCAKYKYQKTTTVEVQVLQGAKATSSIVYSLQVLVQSCGINVSCGENIVDIK